MRGDSHDSEIANLAERASKGEQQAFAQLVERTQRITFPLARRMCDSDATAEEILQDAYVKVWQGLDQLRAPEAVVGWICRIVRNVAVDRHRRDARRRADSLDRELPGGVGALIDQIASDEPDPETTAADAQTQAALLALVDQLKDKHRMVLLLREVDGMSYEEIAEAVGCAVGTVESRLHRARKELAAKIERHRRAMDRESS